jgi:hypothetical protein
MEDDDSAAADRAETLGTNADLNTDAIRAVISSSVAVTPGPAGGSSTTNTRNVGEDRSGESSLSVEGKIQFQDLNSVFKILITELSGSTLFDDLLI